MDIVRCMSTEIVGWTGHRRMEITEKVLKEFVEEAKGSKNAVANYLGDLINESLGDLFYNEITGEMMRRTDSYPNGRKMPEPLTKWVRDAVAGERK